jgi:hypothetical protein
MHRPRAPSSRATWIHLTSRINDIYICRLTDRHDRAVRPCTRVVYYERRERRAPHRPHRPSPHHTYARPYTVRYLYISSSPSMAVPGVLNAYYYYYDHISYAISFFRCQYFVVPISIPILTSVYYFFNFCRLSEPSVIYSTMDRIFDLGEPLFYTGGRTYSPFERRSCSNASRLISLSAG